MAAILQIDHSPRPSLRASVRRLFAQTSRGRNPSSSGMFDRAQNTSIHNATFNINHYSVEAPPAVTSYSPPDNDVAAPTGNANSLATDLERQASPLRRESPDVYVDLLLTKGRGYPLWIPSSNRSLPILNRTLGVSIGDVGVLTPEGGFDFLFNVFHDSEHPINAAVGTPPGFIPFRKSTDLSNTQQFVEWNAGSYLSDVSVTRIDDGRDILKTVLRTTASESAILMMPEDVHTTKLKSLSRLRQYFANNVVAWYTYVKHTLGHDIENGDLKLVYGCRKTSGFGIATAFNAGHAGNTQLTFSVDESWTRASGCPYRWSHIGSAEVKAGPSALDRVDLPAQPSPQNLCLFVNTVDIQLAANVWQEIEELETMIVDDSCTTSAYNSTVPQYGALRQTQGTSALQEGTNSTFVYRSQERTFHPSSILYNALRHITPDAAFWSVCDEDWSDLLTEDIVDASHLLDRLFENSVVIYDKEALVYFSRKEEASDYENGSFTCTFHRINDMSGNETDTSQWQFVRVPWQQGDSTILIDLRSELPLYSISHMVPPFSRATVSRSLKRKFSDGENKNVPSDHALDALASTKRALSQKIEDSIWGPSGSTSIPLPADFLSTSTNAGSALDEFGPNSSQVLGDPNYSPADTPFANLLTTPSSDILPLAGITSPSTSSPTNASPYNNTSALDRGTNDIHNSSYGANGTTNQSTTSQPHSLGTDDGGCWTCRVRRKKCDEQREGDSCKTCKRLQIKCLGWGSDRPDWMRDKRNIETYKTNIKVQLSRSGLIRGQPRNNPMQGPSHHAVPESPQPSETISKTTNLTTTGISGSFGDIYSHRSLEFNQSQQDLVLPPTESGLPYSESEQLLHDSSQ